ncbi:MAG: type III pantothenate kinase [Bacteroidetes bacterium]|jgi:type III pantothenate kinase|nr:MAG: type III pantothenate kinase [Bacteroidota bacterium]
MNLVIDIGNTRIKLAFFKHHLMVQSYTLNDFTEFQTNVPWDRYIPLLKKIIISNVTNTEIAGFVQNKMPHVPIVEVSANMRLPFQIDYETPHTLGSDRIAAVAGAMAEFPKENLLIIDFGTCIKYNFSINGVFAGGAISPGVQMRYNALHHYTGKLPLLKLDVLQLPVVIGKNSFDNLHSGVINGCIAEVRFFIDAARQKYSDGLKIILTGGDAIFFENLLERKVFLRPYLILNGLNELLEYQNV